MKLGLVLMVANPTTTDHDNSGNLTPMQLKRGVAGIKPNRFESSLSLGVCRQLQTDRELPGNVGCAVRRLTRRHVQRFLAIAKAEMYPSEPKRNPRPMFHPTEPAASMNPHGHETLYFSSLWSLCLRLDIDEPAFFMELTERPMAFLMLYTAVRYLTASSSSPAALARSLSSLPCRVPVLAIHLASHPPHAPDPSSRSRPSSPPLSSDPNL